jgi:hypothetical protein
VDRLLSFEKEPKQPAIVDSPIEMSTAVITQVSHFGTKRRYEDAFFEPRRTWSPKADRLTISSLKAPSSDERTLPPLREVSHVVFFPKIMLTDVGNS